MKRIRWLSILAIFALVTMMTVSCSLGPTQAVPTFVPRTTPTPQAGEVYTVERGTLSETLEARGRVVASQEELLFFPLGGYLKTLDVQAGDQLQAGEVVAELEAVRLEDELLDAEYYLLVAQGNLAKSQAYGEKLQLQMDALDVQIDALDVQIEHQQLADAYEIAAAQGEIEIATAGVDACKAQLSWLSEAVPQAETRLRRAQLKYEEVQFGWGKDEKTGEPIPPPYHASILAEFEAAQRGLEQAKANLASQQAECELRKAGVERWRTEAGFYTQVRGLEVQRLEAEQEGLAKEKERLAKEKEINALTIQTYEDEELYRQTVVDRRRERLVQTELKAPFDGVIVSVEKRGGEELEPYEPLGAIADPSVFRVEATVLEEDILKVAVGQSARITLDAYAVNSFPGTVTEIGASPSVWQGKNAYTVYLEFVEPDQVPASIRMGADVQIQVTERSGVLLVPESALAWQGTRAFVTRVSDTGSLEQIEVQVGVSDGQWVEVIQGLSEGQGIQIP